MRTHSPKRILTLCLCVILTCALAVAVRLSYPLAIQVDEDLEGNAPLHNDLVLQSSTHPLFSNDEASSANSANAGEGGGSSENPEGTSADANSTSSDSANASAQSSLVNLQAYYLTNLGQVTSAKLQSPWGSCWAFAIAAALESSILKAQAAESGNLNEIDESIFVIPTLSSLNDDIDLSERAIAWFSHETQSAKTSSTQAGEGLSLVDPTNPLNQLSAGNFIVAEAGLAAEQGFISESAAPYTYNDYDGDPLWFSTGSSDGDSDDARSYSWALDESLRNVNDTGWQIEAILNLESPANHKLDASSGYSQYTGYNPEAILAIKDALVKVGGVAIALEMDESLPQEVSRGEAEQAEPRDHFTYSTWAQFNGNSEVSPNHATTIVGWDDTFSATNFAGTSSGQPPANGAWLCKNNWGNDTLFSELGAISEANHWGLPYNSRGSGGASGFFWLSYYDHSIMTPVAFEVERAPEEVVTLYQYDYLGPAEYQKPASYMGEVQVANMFTATDEQLIESVSAWTFAADETVDVTIYTLPHSTSDITLIDDKNIANLSGYDSNFNPEDAQAVFDLATEVTSVSASFQTGGFHIIDLIEPVLVSRGQRFIIAQTVHTKVYDSNGDPADGSYLNLEVAFLSNPSNQPTVANLVVNPGESFVKISGNNWESVGDYNTWYTETKGKAGQTADIRFGNALIKAYGVQTTMADDAQVYEVVALETK